MAYELLMETRAVRHSPRAVRYLPSGLKDREEWQTVPREPTIATQKFVMPTKEQVEEAKRQRLQIDKQYIFIYVTNPGGVCVHPKSMRGSFIDDGISDEERAMILANGEKFGAGFVKY